MHAQSQQVFLSQLPFSPQPTCLRVLKPKSIRHPKFTLAHLLCPTLNSQQLSCSLQYTHLGVERDFCHALPLKLLLGLTAFYISIASTLVSFATGHFFIFRNQLKFVFRLVYSDLHACNSLFYGSVSTLLSIGVGLLSRRCHNVNRGLIFLAGFWRINQYLYSYLQESDGAGY